MGYPKNITQEELDHVSAFFSAATTAVADESLFLSDLWGKYQDYVYAREHEKAFGRLAVDWNRFRGCVFNLGIVVLKGAAPEPYIPNHRIRDDWDALNPNCWPKPNPVDV